MSNLAQPWTTIRRPLLRTIRKCAPCPECSASLELLSTPRTSSECMSFPEWFRTKAVRLWWQWSSVECVVSTLYDQSSWDAYMDVGGPSWEVHDGVAASLALFDLDSGALCARRMLQDRRVCEGTCESHWESAIAALYPSLLAYERDVEDFVHVRVQPSALRTTTTSISSTWHCQPLIESWSQIRALRTSCLRFSASETIHLSWRYQRRGRVRLQATLARHLAAAAPRRQERTLMLVEADTQSACRLPVPLRTPT